MADALEVPFLSYEQVQKRAAAFLHREHPSGAIPVPIEQIIEFNLELDVIPIPGLKPSFEVDAFITSDMTAIYVDEYVLTNVPNRYRFSLAHELAHAVLHQKTYRSFGISDIESWRLAQARLSERDHSWLEQHAYWFAGLVLVPGEGLRVRFERVVQEASDAGLSIPEASDAARRMIAGKLAREFDVSTNVIEKRLAKESLWQS